jgi:hypothetical protein
MSRSNGLNHFLQKDSKIEVIHVHSVLNWVLIHSLWAKNHVWCVKAMNGAVRVRVRRRENERNLREERETNGDNGLDRSNSLCIGDWTGLVQCWFTSFMSWPLDLGVDPVGSIQRPSLIPEGSRIRFLLGLGFGLSVPANFPCFLLFLSPLLATCTPSCSKNLLKIPFNFSCVFD